MRYRVFRLIATQKKKIAATIMLVMFSELVMPLKALALTSGPSQPEFQAFSPLATSSLVDLFTGDFSYNIPILEIEGYPLNLVYRSTSNVEEEASWVGYGWNLNVGTLNRHVRGLPDDMNGDTIKTYQNVRERVVNSWSFDVEPHAGVEAGFSNIGASAGLSLSYGFTEDKDNYTGTATGYSFGAGVYVRTNVGPVTGQAFYGKKFSAHTVSGASISTYSGWNVGIAANNYLSMGFGQSVTRGVNSITGAERPQIMGTFNVANLAYEIQKNYVGSIYNDIPHFTIPYTSYSDGVSYKVETGIKLGILKSLGLDFGIDFGYIENTTKTIYHKPINNVRGYGYMYAENAKDADMLDFSRDNDGALNRDMPFMPPAVKTFDVFSSTAHNASGAFRADRNDFGIVRDPHLNFTNRNLTNELHNIIVRVRLSIDCGIGITLGYINNLTHTESTVETGVCIDDKVPFRYSKGKDQNLFFRVCGPNARISDDYFAQVNYYNFYSFNKADSIKNGSTTKRVYTSEPVTVFTNEQISNLPVTYIPKQLKSYHHNVFPVYTDSAQVVDRVQLGASGVEKSKIGAIVNINKSGYSYLYATPVKNNIKNEVTFRLSGFNDEVYNRREGLVGYASNESSGQNEVPRDHLYRDRITPSYSTAYLLNAVLSPDYIDVTNDGITDDDLGTYVRFNYTRTTNDYRWRIPYCDKNQNLALLNEGIKSTKFDDMASYVIGSKELWYPHSIESKNYVVEFYTSPRLDGKDSRCEIMYNNHPNVIPSYSNPKDEFAYLYRLDSIKYYNKHDRYLRKQSSIPLKTVYFDYDYSISSNVPNSDAGGKLRLTKVRIRHGNEPLQLAETYDFGYVNSNPPYSNGSKDGWGHYAPNNRPFSLSEFPYINQRARGIKDSVASAYHLSKIGLPSGGSIKVEYESDDYSWVQDRRAMELMQITGIGNSPNLNKMNYGNLYTDDNSSGSILSGSLGANSNDPTPNLFIYVKKPKTDGSGNYSKNFLLNGLDQIFFSFNVKIAGTKYSTFDQVKGYAEVEEIGTCPNNQDYIYIQMKPIFLEGSSTPINPITNVAINTARASVSELLYFQETESPNGHNDRSQNKERAKRMLEDLISKKNSIIELMKDVGAGKDVSIEKSYVRLTMNEPKIGGGSRVSRLTFDDEWNKVVDDEPSSLIGYNYYYIDSYGQSSGVASYEPLAGGEENPLRSGYTYAYSNNSSQNPPYDPIEYLKEAPAGESFFPAGSVGYSSVMVESIHRAYARSAQKKTVYTFYTAKDFPFVSTFTPIKVIDDFVDENYPHPTFRDIIISFLGWDIGHSESASQNKYSASQEFLIETNDMHGKPKGVFHYRLLQKNNQEELISSTEYFYHSNGYNKLVNEVDVIQYKQTQMNNCSNGSNLKELPKDNFYSAKKTLGVEVDVCTDSREVISIETRQVDRRGGQFTICFPGIPDIKPSLSSKVHKHTDYYKITVTTKLVNRFGILKSVREYNEGTETVIENKYYDLFTGEPIVQVYKNEYADNIYSVNVPAYWTHTDLEPANFNYPLVADTSDMVVPNTLHFSDTGSVSYLNFNPNHQLLRSQFYTSHNEFHPGDEIFAYAKHNNGSHQWHRLYVLDVTYIKPNWNIPDNISAYYGSDYIPVGTFKVTVTPYKLRNLTLSDIGFGDDLNDIQKIFKYRPGKKNMLDLSAGKYLSLKDPFVNEDTIFYGGGDQICWELNRSIPVIDASASTYVGERSLATYLVDSLEYNPVSLGAIAQPYVGKTHTLLGDRKYAPNMVIQRNSGILHNWYYWQPNYYHDINHYYAPFALMKHYTNQDYTTFAEAPPNALWNATSTVTMPLPNLGPVEETNPLNIYNAVYLDPVSRNVMHTTNNGKFGQTWVETFEDMRQLRKYNGMTDLIFSPFKRYMAMAPVGGTTMQAYELQQNDPHPNLTGSFLLDSTVSHTGLYSLNAITEVQLKINAVNHNNFQQDKLFYPKYFDFNLDSNEQEFTCEVWVYRNDTKSIVNPIVEVVGDTLMQLSQVSPFIDHWSLHRARIRIPHGSEIVFHFPSMQQYDDLRVYPVTSNVKTYIYHPYRNYLMSVLDENNFATFFEYNTRNQLIRLKKETEKGILTITENIKNIAIK